jgi:hypothetical protein
MKNFLSDISGALADKLQESELGKVYAEDPGHKDVAARWGCGQWSGS